jgi:hypothetical protein
METCTGKYAMVNDYWNPIRRLVVISTGFWLFAVSVEYPSPHSATSLGGTAWWDWKTSLDLCSGMATGAGQVSYIQSLVIPPFPDT